MRVLAIGAHPDDVEVGCGATLALHKQKGHQIHILILTKGEASGDPQIREEECIQSSRIMNADKVFFAHLADTKLTDGVETIREIEKVASSVDPDIVFVHSRKDTHQDHRNVCSAALSACRNRKNILFYESPTTLSDFDPKVYVDVSTTLSKKIEMLEIFLSQRSKPFLNDITRVAHKDDELVSTIVAIARFRGAQARVQMAEAFEAERFVLQV